MSKHYEVLLSQAIRSKDWSKLVRESLTHNHRLILAEIASGTKHAQLPATVFQDRAFVDSRLSELIDKRLIFIQSRGTYKIKYPELETLVKMFRIDREQYILNFQITIQKTVRDLLLNQVHSAELVLQSESLAGLIGDYAANTITGAWPIKETE